MVEATKFRVAYYAVITNTWALMDNWVASRKRILDTTAFLSSPEGCSVLGFMAGSQMASLSYGYYLTLSI